MSRVLVTGASGFVGAAAVRNALDRGHDAAALIRPETDLWRLHDVVPEIELIPVDLRDIPAARRAISRYSPDVVLHMAAHGAYSWQGDPATILATNVLGTAGLLDACAALESPPVMVHAGSSSEYGFKDHPPAEDERLEPNSTYAVGKAASSHLVALAGSEGRLPCVTARLYSVYGPWEDSKRLMPTLVAAALRGQWPPLADPRTARDFVFIADVLDALWAMVSVPRVLDGRAFNVASGKQTTLRDLAADIRATFSLDSEPEWGAFPSRSWDATTWVGDPRRLQRELGWTPQTSMTSGLRQLGAWIDGRSHPSDS